MAKFKVGNTVRLVSGGPLMTVEAVFCADNKGMDSVVYGQLKFKYPGSDVFYSCKWFDDKMRLLKDIFVEETIELDE